MARDTLPSFIGDSIHGQTKASLMMLHQQSLEKTIQSTLTIVDNDSAAAIQHQEQQRQHNKKKKKYYPWIQRDSQNQRNKIGQEGSRRRQRHDNGKCYKFVHHPFAVLYQTDLAFPGYDHDAPSFHWKYDAMIESLIRNNPPSSRRSKPEAESLSENAKASAPAEPLIGHRCLTRAQRKDIKKVHVPQGIVIQYEGELVNFLDQLTLSDAQDDGEQTDDCDKVSLSTISDDELDKVIVNDSGTDGVGDQSNWVMVDKPTDQKSKSELATEQKLEPEPAVEKDAPSKQEQDIGECPQIYLRWDIQDQFLRFVAHALCAFYGLVSFSKTALDGKRWVYICHPSHLDSIGQLAQPAAPSELESAPAATVKPTRPLPPKRQKTLEHVQELPVHELDQLWNKIEPTKVANCLRPDITFFEYLYPSTRPLFC
ncbi:hypothetical protein BGZ50_007716 [Haplosporangium sp. Z 11]|nr:hypothetical protein BGZ50_007716 [Haplosporangium sp. Z 11]